MMFDCIYVNDFTLIKKANIKAKILDTYRNLNM